KYSKECGRGVSMGFTLMVWGDQAVEPFVHESPDVSVICRADLLSSDSKMQADITAKPAMSLARLYLEYGDAFVTQLRGTFAILLYDHRHQLLKAWTDHFGADRLVFTGTDEFAAVATDLRLLVPLLNARPTVDPVSVQEYLLYSCIPGPRTIFQEMSRLKPGHQLICNQRPIIHCYWDMTYR